MGKPCRLTFHAFLFGESWKGRGYDNADLLNGIDYCQNCIDIGLTTEPHDDFSLADFIAWAKEELKKP